jgi:hypothetical protein
MKNLSVRILVTIPKAEHFEACSLVFDTLRVGFPTADIEVTVNPIGAFSSHCTPLEDKLVEKVEAAGAQYGRACHPIHLGDWERGEVERATGPLVLLDADTIFWRSCEDWEFGPETLLAGYYQPRIWNDFARCISMPRIHTSFMVFPNPPELRKAIREAYPSACEEAGDYCPCDPFKTDVKFIGGTPFFWDCCANLFGLLTSSRQGLVYPFGLRHLECYDHLNSASFFDVMLDRLHGDKEAFAYIHRFGPENQRALKDLWPKVNQYYAEREAEATRQLEAYGPLL